MSLESDNGRPVHLPADPKKFVFDGEVSAIFPDMAVRSIPNFQAAHAAHARMLAKWIMPGAKILDVGASRGAFIKELLNEYPVSWEAQEIEVDAIDNSPEMCAHLRMDFPGVGVRCQDLASVAFLQTQQPLYDVVCAHYVLQFLPPEYQLQALMKLFSMVRPGGVFILGHKSKHYGHSGYAAHEEYIRFRMANGYTREEIDAKTLALRGSMFPMDHARVMNSLSLHFSEVCETFRFMMFSTVFCVK